MSLKLYLTVNIIIMLHLSFSFMLLTAAHFDNEMYNHPCSETYTLATAFGKQP